MFELRDPQRVHSFLCDLKESHLKHGSGLVFYNLRETIFSSGGHKELSIVYFFYFQMLNCCIERKRLSKIRTASLQFSTNVNKNSGTRIPNNTSNMESSRKSDSNTRLESTGSQSSISDDEEFFEALENQDESEKETRNYFENFNIEGKTNSDSDIENSDENNASMFKREGGKELFGDLKLLVSGEPLVVPITQVGSD